MKFSPFSDYRRETGHSPALWLALALLNFAVQIVFRRQLEPGEFALLNTLLGLIGLTAVPLVALNLAVRYFHPGGESTRAETVREARLPLLRNFTVIWGFVCALGFLPALDLLGLPRFSLGLFALAGVIVTLGACFCAGLYEQRNRPGRWAFLLLFAAATRLLAAFGFAGAEPLAEAGLAAGICGGLILLTPLFRSVQSAFDAEKAKAAWRDREFRLYLAAAVSVTLGIFLFTNADRIVAQVWFGEASDNNLGLVHWGRFDGYQTAGLLARALLWGTQPLLLLFLARRSAQPRTGRRLRRLFWFYLAALAAGALLLPALALPLAHLFGGAEPEATAYFIPPLRPGHGADRVPAGPRLLRPRLAPLPRVLHPRRGQPRLHAAARRGGPAPAHAELHARGRHGGAAPGPFPRGGALGPAAAMNGEGLSIVMPLYNEGAQIAANVGQTLAALRMLGRFELILVNDGSTDQSGAEIARLARDYPGEVTALDLPRSGKGEALRQGALRARGEFVVFLDADLDLPPEQILFFVAIQRVKKADAVIGSKMHPDSTVDYPFIRRVYSLGYFLLVKALFGLPVRDTQTGLKLVRRDLLLRALEQTECRGFTLDLELLARLVQLGAVMVEAPVVVRHSMKFRSGIGLPVVWQIFHETWRVWRRVNASATSSK